MPELILRNVEESVVAELSAIAQQHGRSLEEEAISILNRAASNKMAAAREAAARMQSRLAERAHSDSVELLSEDRAR